MSKILNDKYFWLIFPFLEPLLFKDYAQWVDVLFTIGKIAALFVLSKEYVSKFKISKFVFIIIIYQLSLLISTILNPDGNIVRYLGPTVSVIGIILYMEIAIKRGKIIKILEIITKCYTIFCIINLFTVLFFPEGITSHGSDNYIYFLGLENRFSFVFLPLVAISALYSLLKYNKIKKFIFLLSFLNTFVLIWKWSVGGMCALILMNIVFFFQKSLFSYRFFNSITCFLIAITMNIMIVFLRVQNNYENFIVNQLDKDITLTGRTLLWDYGLISFIKNPFFGIGYQNLKTLPSEMLHVAHMHNLFMNILYYGGIIGLFLFVMIQFFWIIPLYKHRRHLEVSILNLCLFIALLMSLGDTFDSVQYWILISLSYNVKYILNYKSNGKYLNYNSHL